MPDWCSNGGDGGYTFQVANEAAIESTHLSGYSPAFALATHLSPLSSEPSVDISHAIPKNNLRTAIYFVSILTAVFAQNPAH